MTLWGKAIMKSIRLFCYGRKTVSGAWQINPDRIVNRLYYINAGTAVISYAQREYTLHSGQIYIIPQNYDFRTVNATAFDHTYFDFCHSQILRHDTLLAFDKAELNGFRFFEYINSLLESPPSDELLTALEHLLCGFLTILDAKHPFPYISNTYITTALDIIRREYTTLTTKLLASKLNLDESYFIRLFSSVMDITPAKYIRAYRISYGRQLLQSGMSVAEAAEQCGYRSPTAFYNAIMAELHCSPSMLKCEK